MKSFPLRYLIILLPCVLLSCAGAPSEKEIETGTASYLEKYRPAVHFTPEANWMNDPNGMFYLDGEYHLFYQYYPDSTVWGPMHWGHAVSKDMIHWEHLPVALYPDSLGYIFSGSAVVDQKNTSGLGSAENPPVVAIYTYHDPKGAEAGKNDYQTQGIAFSLEKGVTWEKYEGNPVLSNPGIKDFRDPKVFWHEPGNRWIMSLAVLDHIQFYSSPDLKSWSYESSFGEGVGAKGGVWECPDLFPLRIKESGEEKYVLFVSINPGGPNGGSATQYFVGDFDGNRFVMDEGFLDQGPVWLDYGRDNYAGVTWNGIPETDGRRLFIGWMSNWDYGQEVPTQAWRSAMTIPRKLELHSDLRLSSIPVRELDNIREEPVKISVPHTVNGKLEISEGIEELSDAYELKFRIYTGEKFKVIFFNELGENVEIEVDPLIGACNLYRDESSSLHFSEKFNGVQIAPILTKNDTLDLHIIMDRSSMEAFVGSYKTVMTSIFFPTELYSGIRLITHGPATVEEMEIVSLKTIW